MALGSTQPLSEMSTRNLPGNKRRPECKADNLTVKCELIIYKMWEPRRLTNLWTFTASYRDSFTFLLRWYMHHTESGEYTVAMEIGKYIPYLITYANMLSGEVTMSITSK
jgi:hypothetical protein